MSMTSLGEEFPKEIQRCKELVQEYRAAGPAGRFGFVMIEDVIERAEKAQADQDAVAMMRLYGEMQGCK